MGQSTNENRFGLSDWYDKSSFLTKVGRPKGILSFKANSSREASLIDKGGDRQIKLDRNPEKFYDASFKMTERRLDVHIPQMNKGADRNQGFKSMYK